MDHLRLTQLLCSRICHDLITPVGAINNGFELLGPSLNKADEEMSSLIHKSAQNAAQRLMVFRAGFSYGGQNLLPSFEKTAHFLDSFLRSHKIDFQWNDLKEAQTLVDAKEQPQWGRILINLVSVLTEVAPKGGTLTLKFQDQGEYLLTEIFLKGSLTDLKSDVILALEGMLPEQDVTAHSVQSYLTYLFMEDVPLKLKFLKNNQEEIHISIQSHTNSLQKNGTLF